MGTDGEEFGGFLIENYFYFATLSTLTGGDDQTREILDRTLNLRSDERFITSSGFGHVCGNLHDLLLCVPRIGRLAHNVASDDQVTSHSDPLKYQLDGSWAIYTFLSDWRCPESIDAANTLCAEIYRQALFVYLALMCQYQFIARDGKTVEETVQAHLNTALEYLDMLKLEDPSAIILSFPLAILGCCAQKPHQRSKIRDRLLQQYQADGMKNFRIVIDLLSHLWCQGEERGDMADSGCHFQLFKILSKKVLIG